MNSAAEKLIHDLRNDAHTRTHFAIQSWVGEGTCGTVGCIAGTALFREGRWDRQAINRAESTAIVAAAAGILGIPEHITARHLFIPVAQKNDLVEGLDGLFDYLPAQARPALDTVERMKAWAKSFPSNSWWEMSASDFTPDRCALALERVTKDEIPYCDWAYAFEHA